MLLMFRRYSERRHLNVVNVYSERRHLNVVNV